MKTIKRILAVFLAVMVSVALAPGAFASEASAEGEVSAMAMTHNVGNSTQLSTALATAGDGDAILILNDFVYDGCISFTAKSLIIDVNGKHLTVGNTDWYGIEVDGASLTVTDSSAGNGKLTIKASATGIKAGLKSGDAIVVVNCAGEIIVSNNGDEPLNGIQASGAGSNVTFKGSVDVNSGFEYSGEFFYGAYATKGASVIVAGDVSVTTKSTADGTAIGVEAIDGSSISVSGNVGAECVGIGGAASAAIGVGASDSGSNVSIGGNVSARGGITENIGVGVGGGGTVTINGDISVSGNAVYVKTGSSVWIQENGVPSGIMSGYLEYTDGTSYVWVREVVTDPVCEITYNSTTTPYASVASAIVAVGTGSANARTIKMLKNVSYSTGLVVNNKVIIFDLNGFILNVDGGTDPGLIVSNAGQVKMASSVNGSFNVYGSAYGVYIPDGGIAQVTSASASAAGGCGVYAAEGSVVTVFGNVSISGSTSASRGVETSLSDARVTVNGSIIVPAGATYIKIGSTNMTPSQNAGTSTKPGYLEYTIATSSSVWVKESGWAPVCEIAGGDVYRNLADAINDVQRLPAGGSATVRLLAGIESNQRITLSQGRILNLDLNGHTLNVNAYPNRGVDISGGARIDLIGETATAKFNVSGSNGVYIMDNSGAGGSAAVSSATGATSYAGVVASGAGITINVSGDVNHNGTSEAVNAYGAGTTITVGGNVNHNGTGNGVNASGGAAVIVEGIIKTSGFYAVVGSTYMTQDQGVPDASKPGYLKYTDSGNTATVWVKDRNWSWDGTDAAASNGDRITLNSGSWEGGGTLTVPACATVDVVSTGSGVTGAAKGIRINIGAGAKVNWNASLAAATTPSGPAVILTGAGAFNVAGGAISNSAGNAIFTMVGTGLNSIVLNGGTVSTTSTNINIDAIQINSGASLTVSGAASVSAAAGNAINSNAPVTISEAANLTATGGNAGIYISGDSLTVRDTGKLTAFGGTAGIYFGWAATPALAISDTATVTAQATGSSANSAGLYSDGNITVVNNSPNAANFLAGAASKDVAGIYTTGNLTLEGIGVIIATGADTSGTSGSGIRMSGAAPNLTINGAGLSVSARSNGGGYGIYYTAGSNADAVIAGNGNLAINTGSSCISYAGADASLTIGSGLAGVSLSPGVNGHGISFLTGNNTITAGRPITFTGGGSGSGIASGGNLVLAGSAPITASGGASGITVGADGSGIASALTVNTNVIANANGNSSGLRFGNDGTINGAGSIKATGAGSGAGISAFAGGPYALTLNGSVAVETVGGTSGSCIDAGAVNRVGFTGTGQTLTATNRSGAANSIGLAMPAGFKWDLVLNGSISPDINTSPAVWQVPGGATAIIKLAASGGPVSVVTGVTVSPAETTVKQGETQLFTHTVTGLNNPAPSVTWTVEGAEKPATVISTGGLLSVAADEGAETLTVRATSVQDPTKSAAATVTVVNANELEKITITGDRRITLDKNTTKNLVVVYTPAAVPSGQQGVTWVSNNPKVADVDATGVVTAIGPGSASIAAISTYNSSIYDFVWVDVPDDATSAITIKSDDVTIDAYGRISETFVKNKTAKLAAIDSDKLGAVAVTWKTNDAKVATVSATGVVKHIAPGTATITATGKSGTLKNKTGKVTITIKDTKPRLPASSIKLNTKSDGTVFTILPTDTFYDYDDVEITKVVLSGKTADQKAKFSLSKTGDTAWRLSSGNAAKGKYIVDLQATKSGVKTGDKFKLTVNVATAVPKPKAKMPALNTFWKDASGQISISGSGLPKVSKVVLADSKTPKTDGYVTYNYTVTPQGRITVVGFNSYNNAKPQKPAVNGILRVYYEGYGENFYPLPVTVSIKSSAPKLTLSPAKQTIDKNCGLDTTFGVKGGKIESVDQAAKTKDNNNNMIDSYSHTGSGITVSLKNNAGAANTLQFSVWLENATKSITVKPKVNTTVKAATYKLSAGTVTMSSALSNQTRTVNIVPNLANVPVDATVAANAAADAQGITVEATLFNNKELIVTVPKGAKAGTYKFKITPNEIKTPLELKVVVKGVAPAVTVSAKGNIDLMNRGGTMRTYTPKITNSSSSITSVQTSPAYKTDKAKTIITDYEKFDAEWNLATKKVELRTKAGETYQKGATYKLRLEFVTSDGDTVYTGTLNVKPAHTKVKHPIPKTTLKHQSRTGIENHVKINLKATAPKGAKIESFSIKKNPNNAYWYYFDYKEQVLHVWIKDGALAKPGKATLVFSALYEGQGHENIGTKAKPKYGLKPVDVKIPLTIAR